jgi:type IV pilus assembly protein PilM
MIEDLDDPPVQDAAARCVRCAAVNVRRRKFCAKCGAPLWITCLQCGELSEAGEKYCGNCGTNVVETSTNQSEHVEGCFRTMQQMRTACRFDEAVAVLLSITKQKHPSLAEHVARAKQLLVQVLDEREQRRVEAVEEYQRATQLFSACDYEGAARILEKVPAAIRNDDVEKLREQVSQRREQVAKLTEELREAVREKRVLDLLPRIAQLLELKPDHAYARKLAEQAQECVNGLVERRLADHQYDEALDLSERIVPAVRTPRTQELYRQAAELASLSWDLRNAPVIDTTMLAVAERLRKLATKDVSTAKLCETLRRRGRRTDAAPSLKPVPWARPPQPTALGFPIVWLAGFDRLIGAEGLDGGDLAAHPGRFAVACGLALAGLRQAAIDLDLLADHRGGVLRRVSRLVQSRTVRSAWGIDLSASGLKAVRLSWDASQRQAIIESAILIEHAKSLSQAANEAEERKLLTETLKAFLERHPPKAERTCVALPGRMVLTRQLDLPPADPDKLPNVVEFEARHELPFPLEQLAWDHEIFDALPDTAAGAAESTGPSWRQALVVAAKTTTMRHFLDVFRGLGIRVDMLQTDFIALHNFVLYEQFAPRDETPAEAKDRSGVNGGSQRSDLLPASSVVAAIDVGTDATNLVVSSPHSLWYRSCGVAGQSFTRALVKDFNLTIVQAEQLKRAPESAERFGKVFESMSPGFEEFLKESQETLAAYARAEPNHPIQRVFGVGGGFTLHGLFRYLRCGR